MTNLNSLTIGIISVTLIATPITIDAEVTTLPQNESSLHKIELPLSNYGNFTDESIFKNYTTDDITFIISNPIIYEENNDDGFEIFSPETYEIPVVKRMYARFRKTTRLEF
jgi:hypothetical protein